MDKKIEVTKKMMLDHVIQTIKHLLPTAKVEAAASRIILNNFINSYPEEVKDIPDGPIDLDTEAQMVMTAQKVINNIMRKSGFPLTFTIFKKHKPRKKELPKRPALYKFQKGHRCSGVHVQAPRYRFHVP